jgi:hypothetical protein
MASLRSFAPGTFEESAMTTLDEEIGEHRSEIRTTQWSASIGEFFSLYERDKLIINPAFQRFFRWNDQQKTYLIESILLGLPVPPLFLAQSPDGDLEVVDGVQRLSTLLQFRGLLKRPASDDSSELKLSEPLVMEAGQYLQHLDGLLWSEDLIARVEDAELVTGSLTEAQRSDIEIAKLDATIIQRTSTPRAKYDVFRRLNSYGEALTSQEMRAALIASVNGACLKWLASLARDGDTPELLSLSDRLLERQYDVELALRFFYLAETEELKISELRNFSGVLDDYGLSLADEFPSPRTEELNRVFRDTFSLIQQQAGPNFFRRYLPNEHRFRGPFLNTSFEALASPIGYHLLRSSPIRPDLMVVVEEFWRSEELSQRFATGRSTEWRLANYVPLGRELMAAR